MTTVNIHAAKTHLSRLVDAAAKGEEIVIARPSKPVAQLIPFEAAKKPDRVLGTMAGQFTIPNDSDAPLPGDVLALFEKR